MPVIIKLFALVPTGRSDSHRLERAGGSHPIGLYRKDLSSLFCP